MIKKGDIVKIKPEWQDANDEKFTWVAIEDEDGGRVRIMPSDIGLAFPPNQVVTTDMLVIDENKQMEQMSFASFELIIEAYAVHDLGDSSSYAAIMVDEAFVKRLKQVQKLCEQHKLESVSLSLAPDFWESGDELRIGYDSLRVSGESFWFEAIPKHAGYSVETRMIDIRHLELVAQAISNAKIRSDVELPPGFVLGCTYLDKTYVGYGFTSEADTLDLIQDYRAESA